MRLVHPRIEEDLEALSQSSEVQAVFKRFGPVAMLIALVGAIFVGISLFSGTQDARESALQP